MVFKSRKSTSGSSGGRVTSVNGETGAITLTSAGNTVLITEPTANTINLEAVGSGGNPPGGVQYDVQLNDGAGGFAGSNDLNFQGGYLTINGDSGYGQLQWLNSPASSGYGGSGINGTATPIIVGALNGDLSIWSSQAMNFSTDTGSTKMLQINTDGTVFLSSLTASELTATDGSKNLQSLTTATYPSLTEISYVKGVTSAIQTQLNAKGSGTVTAVSVASANGFAGSSSGGATPALTISTSITGVLLGNGTAISASNVTNDAQTKAAIVPNTAPSSGQILVGNAGGTAYAPVSSSGDVTIASTGAMTIANNAVTTAKINNAAVTYAKIQNVAAVSLLGNPTGSPASPSEITLGLGLNFSGTTLVSTGSGGTVTSVSGTTNRITSTGGATPVIDISASYVGQSSITTLGTIATGTWTGTTIAVANGGTGQTTYTDGQLLIGNTTGNTLAKAALTGTANQVVVTNGHGTITLSTPQDIAAASTPTFGGLTLNGTLAMGANNITMTGTLGATGARLTKGWFTDLQVTNAIAGSITGNATTATALATGRTISITGDLAYTSPSFDGSGNVTAAGTLATVNSNTGTFGSATQSISLTLNGKGLATAASNVTITPAVSSITGLGTGVATFLASPSSTNLAAAITDETGTGALVFGTSPTIATASLGSSTATTQAPSDNSTKLATTAYVATALLGQDFKEACKYASTAALPSIVYANGSSGVGATLTGVALAAISLDSSSPAVNDRVLIKNQVSTFQNGIYTVTATGSGIAVFVLTRSADFNQSSEIDTGDTVFITAGATQSTTTWAYNGIDQPTIGTDAITFAQTAGQGSFTAGNGIAITGTSIAIDTSVTVDKNSAQTLTSKTLTAPIMTAPVLGTPASGVATNLTGTAAGLTAGAVTNATLTTALTVNTGTLTLTANSANTSVLTIGTGAVSVSGSNTGDQTSVSGNAGTATALQNARTIGGVSFDGTGNIVPQTIQSINEATDTTCFPLFINDSGSVSDQPKNNTSLTFNSNTANLGSTIFNAGTGFQIGGAASSGKFLVGNGTNYVASTSTIPTSAGATANKLLLSDGTNYALSTPTFPNASAISGKIIKSDGTNWIASTETYAAPGTSGNILTSDGTNWTSSAPVVTASSTNTFTNKTYDTAGTGNSFSINGVAATANTGTGAVARASSPAFITPTLGAALATSINFGGTTLSNYAEGTWTPTITTSGTVGTPAYTAQTGDYTRIGRLVILQFNIFLSGWTGSPTGNVSISGVPLVQGGQAGMCNLSFYTVNGLASLNYGVSGLLTNTTIALYQGGNSTCTAITAAQFGTGADIYGMCIYHV